MVSLATKRSEAAKRAALTFFSSLTSKKNYRVSIRIFLMCSRFTGVIIVGRKLKELLVYKLNGFDTGGVEFAGSQFGVEKGF